jgi:hypothetical protein
MLRQFLMEKDEKKKKNENQLTKFNEGTQRNKGV